ncbi:plasma membrane channel protein, partial [Phlyctema vagabunda]
YFAFLQSYFVFLVFPAIFGALSWFFLAHFSPLYAVVNCLWSVVFVEYWKRQEVDLAVTWAVRGVSAVKAKNIDFKANRMVRDPVTGEFVPTFSMTQRLLRQLLQIPFALLAAVLLGALIALCFAIEVFIEDVYDGPLKGILVYVPMAIITLFMPYLQNPLSDIATKLATYENYEIASMHETALVQKMFVLDFITSFLPIFLVAFVYLPFGDQIVPYLNFHHAIVRIVQFIGMGDDTCNFVRPGFSVDPERLKYQIIYFAVSAQGMNFINEVLLPFLKRKGFNKFEEYKRKTKYANKLSGPSLLGSNDALEEAAFLYRVRKEAELEDYDVNTDLREMCEQFGYLSLFSVVWPLTAVAFLIGNWFELRSDALKICYEKKRPVPWRVDTIGPWLDHLGLLAWLGSLSSAALVFLFTGDTVETQNHKHSFSDTYYLHATGLLLTIFFSEHLYLLARISARVVLARFESPGLKKERGEKYLLRKRYMEESLALDDQLDGFENLQVGGQQEGDRDGLGLASSRAASSCPSPAVGLNGRFWSRQRQLDRVVDVGNSIIARSEAGSGRSKLQ